MVWLQVLSLLKNHSKKSSSSNGTASVVLRILLRLFQFVMAVTVAGLYGVDIHHWHQDGEHADARWVYAEAVAGIAAITVLVYAVPFIKSYKIWAWDVIVFLLYVVLFGIFGKMYIGTDHHDNTRMKHAVYVDAVNMILWCVTAGYSALLFFRERKNGGEKNHAVV